MGLGSLSAELARSVGVDPSAQRGSRAADRSASRFDDYLAEARSAHRSAQAQEPDASDEPDRLADTAADDETDKARKSDSKDETSDHDAETPAAAATTVTSVADAGLLPAPPSPPVNASPVPIAPSGPDTNQAPSNNGAPATTPVPQAVSGSQAATGASILQAGSILAVAASGESAAAPSASTNPLPTDRLPEPSAAAQPSASSTSRNAEAAAGPRLVSVEDASAQPPTVDTSTLAATQDNLPAAAAPRPVVPTKPQRNPATSNDANRRSAKTQPPGTERPPAAQQPADGETLHQQKVREANEARVQNSAGGQRSGAQKPVPNSPAGSAPAASDVQPGALTRTQPPSIEGTETPGKLESGGLNDKAAALRSLSSLESSTGDSGPDGTIGLQVTPKDAGAATFARHLATATISGGAGDTSASAVGRGTTTMGTVSQTVGDVLSGGLTGPDGPANGARVTSATAAGPGRFQMALQLDPPELGQVRLNIQMQQQAIALHVDVQNRSVAKLIESRLSELQDALAAQGIRIDRADVVVRSPANGDASLNQQPDRHGGDPSQASGEQAGRWSTSGGGFGGAGGNGSTFGGRPAEAGDAAWDAWRAEPAGEWEPALASAAGDGSLNVVA